MLLITLVVIWAAITLLLIGSIIYRSIVGIHEEDQLFLDQAESLLEKEQEETLRRIHVVDPLIKWSGAASGALLLVIAAIWVYQGIYAPPLP